MLKKNVFIFGNSPNCNTEIEIKDDHDLVVLGNGMKFLKDKKFKYWFTRIGKYDKKFSTLVEKTFIVSPIKYKIEDEDNVFWIDGEDIVKYTNPYFLNIYPTLGLFSILYLKDLYENIYISGFTLDIKDAYIDYGYFWDKSGKQDNKNHTMWKEMLFLKKMLRDKKIYEF